MRYLSQMPTDGAVRLPAKVVLLPAIGLGGTGFCVVHGYIVSLAPRRAVGRGIYAHSWRDIAALPHPRSPSAGRGPYEFHIVSCEN